MTVEPVHRAAPGAEAMRALLQAMALARIDDQPGRGALLDERAVEFLRLVERRAAVLATVQDERRRARPLQPAQRRALDGDPAEARLVQGSAADPFREGV